MPYQVTLHCDEETCKNEVQVPQVGATPVGWVLMGFVKPNLDLKTMTQTGMESVTKTFCSWMCAYKYIKARIRGVEDVQNS